jgi:type IX secretion system PorP/SprF family membrane protein
MNTEMKKVIIILFGLIPAVVLAQQFPFMEGYAVNTFSLTPAYAGIHNSKTLFIDYRSDWSGIDGGPTTYQLSYNDKFSNRVGLGGRFIYDKTDIFKQTLVLGTYTYEVHIADGHLVNFGLSMGFFRNSIDMAKYYNDPSYVQDMVLINGRDRSKIKFATDISALYRHKHIEAGIYFSNIMFGTIRYRNTDMSYKPLKNYLLHASYLYNIDGRWSVRPTVIARGGQNIPVQLELASTFTWNDRFWGTILFRSGGIFGVGIGGEVYDGILLSYSHNISTNVIMNTFGTNQLTLGVKIFKLLNNKKTRVESE